MAKGGDDFAHPAVHVILREVYLGFIVEWNKAHTIVSFGQTPIPLRIASQALHFYLSSKSQLPTNRVLQGAQIRNTTFHQITVLNDGRAGCAREDQIAGIQRHHLRVERDEEVR